MKCSDLFYRCTFVGCCVVSACFMPAAVSGAPRDVQIRSIDFEASTIELFNFGSVAEDLSGWRFCTHDENQSRQYSDPSGLNGVSIGPSESLFIHMNNDAPADPNTLNVSWLNRFAGPLDRGPYAIGFYFPPTEFSNGNQIADYVQWNIDGRHNDTADSRSDEAREGGVWVNQRQWVVTTPDTLRIELIDHSASALHGPDSYFAILPELEGITLNGSDDTYLQDFDLALGNNGTATGQPLPTGWSGSDRARFFKEVVTESFPADRSLGRGTLLFNAGAGQDPDRALAIGVGGSTDEGVLQLLADVIEQDASSLRLQFDLEVWDAARTNVDLPGEAAFDLTVDINTGDGFTQLIDLGTVTTGPGLLPAARDFLDGNVDPNRVSFDSDVLSAPIPAGSTLRVRWTVDAEAQTRGWVYGLDNVALSLLGDGGTMLQAGDADKDLDFDQLDLVRVQIVGKYLTGQAATWVKEILHIRGGKQVSRARETCRQTRPPRRWPHGSGLCVVWYVPDHPPRCID